MQSISLLALAGLAAATQQGFNYGATASDGSAMLLADFEALFTRAQDLQGTSGFTSARLYTMIQADTTSTYTQAIEAAIKTQTTLLLGLWASDGQADFDYELTALKDAIAAYGTSFTDLIEGISVGSEDLYRDSVDGIEADEGTGATPDELVSYIAQVRDLIAGTDASAATVGHVDTWNAWTNTSNAAVITAVDWLGMDGYPYYQTTDSNGIDNAESLFFASYDATVDVADGKDVWITETGWPYQGPTEGDAVASIDNAETYWQDVACRLIGNYNTYWYTLQETTTSTSDVSFGLIGNTLADAPLYNLTCSSSTSSTSTSSAATSTKTSTAVSSASEASSKTESAAEATSAATSAVETATEASAPEASATAYAASTAVEASAEASTPAAYTSASSEETFSTGYVTSSAVETSASPVESIATGSVSDATSSCTSTATAHIYSTTFVTVPVSSATSAETATSASAATSASSSCPTDLSGTYQYPHLIVPINSSSPTTAYGTSYDGTITPTVSTIFNFDIPASYSGKTCSLVFLFPTKAELETSSFTFNDEGSISVSMLESAATKETTYDTAPSKTGSSKTLSGVEPGNSYLVFTGECASGETIAYEFSSEDGLSLEFFEDYNPSPIGAYVTVC